MAVMSAVKPAVAPERVCHHGDLSDAVSIIHDSPHEKEASVLTMYDALYRGQPSVARMFCSHAHRRASRLLALHDDCAPDPLFESRV
jgi:hypothetical protein